MPECYFGGPFALNWASDDKGNLGVSEKKLARRQEKRGIVTRYWTPAVHNAAFALPGYAQTVVDEAKVPARARVKKKRPAPRAKPRSPAKRVRR